MAIRNYRMFSGNKASLRAKSYHQIKRIEFISNSLGSLGDLLVSTILGMILALLVMAGGIFVIVIGFLNGSTQTIASNLLPDFMILAGSLLIALNVLLTNPSSGLQFVVSMRFVRKKINERGGARKLIAYDPFKFVEGIDDKSILEMNVDGKTKYLVFYKVRGTISPVNFESELNELAGLNSRLLFSMERDTVLTVINSISVSKVEKVELPDNATEAMRKKRDINYRVTSELQYNQQLNTIVALSTDTLDVMRSRIETMEVVFRQGLVVGYLRLRGEELKREVKAIYE